MVGLTPHARKVGLLGCSWQALSHCLHQMVGLPPPAKRWACLFPGFINSVTLPPPDSGPASTCERWACLLPGLVKLCHSACTRWWPCLHLQRVGLLVSRPGQQLTSLVVKAVPTAHKCHPTRVKPCHHRVQRRRQAGANSSGTATKPKSEHS